MEPEIPSKPLTLKLSHTHQPQRLPHPFWPQPHLPKGKSAKATPSYLSPCLSPRLSLSLACCPQGAEELLPPRSPL